ncbi:MAG: 3-oxoacyl-ACP reductase FabG [Gammaproteobacteria bacterium]|nr:3-oxoacyl-ACP reductase FabG [Gammaproteobacteria bacterium]MDH5800338.1 3-oxoacyl-ACP reductase FabG [Gammaproteobacteria bacterium]
MSKVALVTGGSGGIGAEICRRLAQDGHQVYVHANQNKDKAEQLVQAIEAEGGQAQSIVFDVTDAEQTRCLLTELAEKNPIQILVNNAGIHSDAPMAGMSTEQWDKVLQVSLNGFFNVTQPLLLPMMATRWGRIINSSSIAGITGNRGQANYAAAKAGLHGATKTLAKELASRGVTVNCVAPGIIETEMTEGVFDAKTIKAMVPMKRAGKPEEVAALVSFLASDQAAYISGQIININGAMV